MDLAGVSGITSIRIGHLEGLMLGSSHFDPFLKLEWLDFCQRKKVPEMDRVMPLTHTYLGAIK